MRLDSAWARWIGARRSTALSSMARWLLQFPGVPVVRGGSSSLVGSRGSPRAKVGLGSVFIPTGPSRPPAPIPGPSPAERGKGVGELQRGGCTRVLKGCGGAKARNVSQVSGRWERMRRRAWLATRLFTKPGAFQVDGAVHDARGAEDEQRDDDLGALGLGVLRVRGADVLARRDGVLRTIAARCESIAQQTGLQRRHARARKR